MTGNAAPSGEPAEILILANPTAGSFDARLLEAVSRLLTESGRSVRLHLTQRAGEIGAICAEPSLSAGIIVVAGGDGSVNEALGGLVLHAAPPALAVIPFGTANVLAQELRLPFKAHAIAEMILDDRRVPLHHGLANGRPFVLMASAGFDAEVVHAVPLAMKRRYGKLSYVATALKRFAARRPKAPLTIKTSEKTISARLAVVTNGRCYGGAFVICPDASVTRSGLHLIALERDDAPFLLRAGLALAFRRLHKMRGVRCFAANRVEITAEEPVAAQIDGDPFATTPLLIESGGESIPFIVPRPNF
ncbi:diacylglycerol kinase family lipid kinase [Stappia sp. F7233]|uniref:Diacylglycerol kinase family lipid kinase n=1 Tax=Stappia albiluteola TaxID=2758565 RepID=A0A839AI29_9HYPH|nr:diacylglycerol kinase family protein [Stappia albiluteola]MBA5778397.1 diacylglycerol kinase family lipid kinase [Stappia albiluteola]